MNKKVKISIITWDACFREKFHTVDSFCNQDYPVDDFEFIWVDFYHNTNQTLLDKIDKYQNAKLVNLDNATGEKWHLGKCMNAGIKEAKGDVLVLPDGDIIVQKDHLQEIEKELKCNNDLILYFRRWDEEKRTHSSESYDEVFLEKNCVLSYATNYGGCCATYKKNISNIGYYEENNVFAGAGANGFDNYLRFRNAGYAIKWHNKKIYHPWHAATNSSDKSTLELQEISKHVSWLKPYSGILQSWVLKSRELDLSYMANNGAIEQYIKSAPDIEMLRGLLQNKTTEREVNNGARIKKIVKKFFS